MSGWQRMLCWAAAGAVLIAAPTAMAQDRVAVLGIGGPQGGQARAAVVRQLQRALEVVDQREWNRTASRLGAKGRSPRAIARVAEELGVKAVVDGDLRRAGRRWSLVLTVRDGASGAVVGRESRAMRNLGGVAAAGAAAGRAVLALVEQAEGAAGGAGRGGAARGGEREERDEPDPPPDRDRDEPDPPPERYRDEPDPGRAPDRYSAIEDERPPMFGGRGEAPQADDPDPPPRDRGEGRERRPRGPSRGSPHGWLDFSLEINGASRDFNVPINAALDTGGRDAARFNSSVFPEIGLRASFYPVAIFNSGWASGLGLEGSFHHHLYLKVFNRRQNQEVQSEEYAFTTGVVYRGVYGSVDRGATFWARVGFGRFSFFLGDLYNDIVPPFVYDHVYVLLSAHIPLGTRHAGVDLGAGYLAVLGVGADATAAYNASGQLPTAHGFRFHVGASGQIYRGLRWRLAFEMLGFISFHQDIGRGWGQDPTTRIDRGGRGIQTVGSAVDIFWRLIPQLEYRFGGGAAPATSRPARDDGSGRGDWYDSGAGRRRGRGQDDERPTDDDWDSGGW